VLCRFEGSLFCGRVELSRFSSTVSPAAGLRHGDVSTADVGLDSAEEDGEADAGGAEAEMNATGKTRDAEASAKTSFCEAEENTDLLSLVRLDKGWRSIPVLSG
jgi:hypothetical protein